MNMRPSLQTAAPRLVQTRGRFVAGWATGADELADIADLRARAFFGATGDRLPDDGRDAAALHLTIRDATRTGPDGRTRLAGAYRLIHHDPERGLHQFASAEGFELAALVAAKGSVGLCEVSRAVVDPDYRQGTVIALLWSALAAHARSSAVGAYFGAASLPGADALAHRAVLAGLVTRLDPQGGWQAGGCHALPRLAKADLDLRALPPLLRAYLAAGGFVADAYATDPVFDTTDVLVMLPLARAPARFAAHFSRDNGPLPA